MTRELRARCDGMGLWVKICKLDVYAISLGSVLVDVIAPAHVVWLQILNGDGPSRCGIIHAISP